MIGASLLNPSCGIAVAPFFASYVHITTSISYDILNILTLHIYSLHINESMPGIFLLSLSSRRVRPPRPITERDPRSRGASGPMEVLLPTTLADCVLQLAGRLEPK